MIHNILKYFLILNSISASAQLSQLNITRVDQMPDLPAPLVIRDWQKTALDYDNLVFDLSRTGQYLPLSSLGTAGQFNYPGNTPAFLDSYVGVDNHLNQAEAINLMPALVGASLAGVDKSNQNGMNWVAMSKDFFNLKNGQNVYLNGYSTTSGHDWWYDVMPNVYFYQLRSLYPDAAPEFDSQFTTVADRWLNSVFSLGGSTIPWSVPNMNFRAFNLITSLPLTTGVVEPESAGSIAWLLYNAYTETQNNDYLEGAQMALDFLLSLDSNPSYELQLPYGALTAARINAVEGTNYSLQKLLGWCFSRGDLRGWGAIVGKWGDYDVSGLIGEANDAGNDYAFVMNGFQQVAALAPLPKYDKRYARAIAKWILNVTNASRLFYWDALPQSQQDSYGWASLNDPDACIPYESMKETFDGKSPFATGDAIGGGWASTNLSLYSGSSVGYLAAVVKTTNIEGILQIDMNNTDFYGQQTIPTFLYYNPTPVAQLVNLDLPTGTFDMYDAITESMILTNVSGTVVIPVPSNEVRMVSLIAAGSVTESRNGKLYIGQNVVDYHYGYNFSSGIRVKALAVDKNPASYGQQINAWCEVGNLNAGNIPLYEWFLDGSVLAASDQKTIAFTAPASSGSKVLKCRITMDEQVIEDTLHIHVLEHIPQPPDVQGILPEKKYVVINTEVLFTVQANPSSGETLSYAWSCDGGSFGAKDDNTISWTAPADPGIYAISVNVKNQDNLSTLAVLSVLVKDTTLSQVDPLIYYPFDTDTKNFSSDRFHATAAGVTRTADQRGDAEKAFRFTSGSDIIYTPNDPDLNFTDQVTISCWVKCENFGTERFIISHGSWQQRYKISITPEGKFRWTLKTDAGVIDLDGSAIIDLNRYYHLTVLYTGYSMEMYVDGEPDTFTKHSGNILSAVSPLTLGRMNESETQYVLSGSLDEVKIWNREIPAGQIRELQDEWSTPTAIRDITEAHISVYPNPVSDMLYIDYSGTARLEYIMLFSTDGTLIKICNEFKLLQDQVSVQLPPDLSGLYLIRLVFANNSTMSKKIIVY